MQMIDRGVTATTRIRDQNATRFLLGSSVRSVLIRSHSAHPSNFMFPAHGLRFRRRRAQAVFFAFVFFVFGFMLSCFRRYVSIRDFCVGGQNIHFTFSTRAADMHADMQMVDCGATATTGLRFQNNLFHVAHTQKDKVTYVRRI